MNNFVGFLQHFRFGKLKIATEHIKNEMPNKITTAKKKKTNRKEITNKFWLDMQTKQMICCDGHHDDETRKLRTIETFGGLFLLKVHQQLRQTGKILKKTKAQNAVVC